MVNKSCGENGLKTKCLIKIEHLYSGRATNIFVMSMYVTVTAGNLKIASNGQNDQLLICTGGYWKFRLFY